MVDLKKSNEDGYAGMSGMTAYNHVDGEFFLHRMPAPDEQIVKQTIQGIVDEFIYKSDEISLQSILKQNEKVKITETVYLAETKQVINKSLTSYDTDSSGNPFNRFVIQGGAGEYDTILNQVSSSVHDEVIAIAVEDIRPFMIKGLDVEHSSNIVNGKPTNDQYIKHLTPSNNPLIASIKSPSILTSAGGPSRILVYYDAIDLTGEVVAGTNLPSGDVNARMTPYHSQTNKSYLVVKKMIPAATTMFDISGSPRSLSDILIKPYSSPPATASDVQLEITSSGGIIDLPVEDFKRPIKSHVLKTNGFGGSFPSPFIDVTDCMITVKNSLIGYGRPKKVLNQNTPDPTSNQTFNVLTITPIAGKDLTSFDGNEKTPTALLRSNMQVFNIIDNLVKKNSNLILITPSNQNKYSVLDELSSTATSNNPQNVEIEIALVNGRAEEFITSINNDNTELTIRGRSNLMDLTDTEVQRNLNLGQSSPIKEIGDMGTPTVSMTLGGLGQGGIDTKPEWVEHSYLKGWKDRLVSSGNASVRNDKQTSTDYASTRALVEIPLFPSMFYDVEELYQEIDGISDGIHPEGKEFTMTVDCTMTAQNRVQMRTYEARNSFDNGMTDSWAAIEFDRYIPSAIDSSNHSFGLKAQMPSIQAVVTAYDLTLGTSNSYIEVDDVEAFVNETLQGSEGPQIDAGTGVLTNKFFITVGEGLVAPTTDPSLTYCTYYLMRVHKIDNATNRIYVDAAFLRYPQNDLSLNLSTSSPRADSYIFTGAIVMLGGVIVNSITGHGVSHLKYISTTDRATLMNRIRIQLRSCLGISASSSSSQKIHSLQLGNRHFIIIKNHINMNGLEWDIFNEWGADNNRELKQPIVCYPNFTALKGIDSNSNLSYVLPNVYSFRDIALKSDGFKSSVEELIRTINMNAHPKAKNSSGFSAFDPPSLVSTSGVGDDTISSDSGGNMGYIRAFLGKQVESRTGEEGLSIVIHSTIPGATGRNFAVWLSNKSIYPYKPIQAIGHGGLLATNSRSYQTNSFPAPMPIGADGETFVPITTFTGAPHGSLTHSQDTSNTLREYNGIGSYFTTTTISTTTGLATSYVWDAGNSRFSYLTVNGKAMDYLLRSSSSFTGSKYVRVNGRLATYDSIEVNYGSNHANGECWLLNVTPLIEPDKFKNEFYDGATELYGIEIEFIYPLRDTEAILFFGGGHTGVVFDISDGSKNDYSSFYKHPYANGPNGFSGFQNVGSLTAPSCVLDFTDVLNEDTINDDTLKGFHHQHILNSNNEPEGKCAFYARLSNGLYDPSEDVPHSTIYVQNNGFWREDLYNKKLRVSTTGFKTTSTAGASSGYEVTPSGGYITIKPFELLDCVSLYHWTGVAVKSEHGEVKEFNPTNTDWCVSTIVKPQSSPSLDYFTGPVFHAIYDDGTNYGKPYGLHLGGSPASSGSHAVSVAISFPNIIPFQSPLSCSVLIPSVVSGGTIEVKTAGLTFIMAGRSGGNSFLYMGNTVGITDPTTGSFSVGIFDYSNYLLNTEDQHYGASGTSPNVKANFETKTSGYAGGDNDHPNIQVGIGTIRDLDMALIGCALIGAPYVDVTSAITQGGHSVPNTTDYFTAFQSGTPTYGTTAPAPVYGDGKNSNGPIHFCGFLSEVALWKRALTFTDASNWFNSRTKW